MIEVESIYENPELLEEPEEHGNEQEEAESAMGMAEYDMR